MYLTSLGKDNKKWGNKIAIVKYQYLCKESTTSTS